MSQHIGVSDAKRLCLKCSLPTVVKIIAWQIIQVELLGKW